MTAIDYRSVFEFTPTPCLLLDLEFNILAASRAYAAAVHRDDLVLLVTGLNPGDRVLRANYNQIIRDYGRHADVRVDPDTLARTGALEPRDPRVRFVVAGLRQQQLR